MVRTRRDREHTARKQQWADEADGNEDYCYDYCSVREGRGKTARVTTARAGSIDNYEEDAHPKRRAVRRILGDEYRGSDAHFHDALEYEVDYKHNPTQLFCCISHRLWDMAISQLKLDPSEARVWIACSYDEYEDSGEDSRDEFRNLKWRNLPLHLALLHAPDPAPLSLVQALLDEYPNACRCRNSEGNLPIHLACDNYSLVNNGVDGEGILFVLVETCPDSLLEPDKDGKLPLELLEIVGRGKTWRGKNIMDFMRRQMMMQEERRLPRNDLMSDSRKTVDREERFPAAPVQRRSRSMERPSKSVHHVAMKHRSHSMEPSKSETSNARSRDRRSRGTKKDSRRSHGKNPSRTRRHRESEEDRREGDKDCRHQYNICSSSSGSQSSSSTLDYGKLLFDPKCEYESGRKHHASKPEKELEAKLARALKDNMSLRCSLERSSLSRQDGKLAKALDTITYLQNTIDTLTKDSKDDKRPLRKAAAELKSVRNNVDVLEKDIRVKEQRAQSQKARIAELEETVTKANDKNATMQGTIAALRDANDLLHDRINTSTKTIETMQARQETMYEKVERKSEYLEEHQAKYHQAQSKIDELSGAVTDGQGKIDEYKREVRCLKDSNLSQEKKIDSLANMNDALREKVTTLKDIVKKNSSAYQKRFDSMKEKIESQTEETNRLENDVTSAQKASILRERRVAELMSTQKALGDHLMESKETIAESEEKIGVLEKANVTLNEQSKELSNLRSQAKSLAVAMQSEQAKRIANSNCEGIESKACDDLNGRLEVILNTSTEVINEKAALQQRLEAMISTRTKEEAKLRDMSTELWASKSQIESLKHTMESLETALDAKGTAADDYDKAKKAFLRQIQEAEEKTDKAEAETKLLRQQLSNAKSREEALKTKLIALGASNEAYSAELSTLTEEQVRAQGTMAKLETQNAELKKKLIKTNEERVQYIAEIEEYCGRIAQQSNNISGLEETTAHLRTANGDIQSENGRLTTELKALKSEKSDLVHMQAELNADKATLEQSVSDMARQADIAREETESQMRITSDLESKISGIEQDYRALCSERNALKKDVLAGQDLELEKDSLKKAVSSLHDVASDYRSKIQDLNVQLVERNNESRAKINALKIANKEFEKDIDRLQTEMTELKAEKQGTEERNEKLLMDKSSLEKALQEMNEQGVTLKDQIEGQKQIIHTLEDSLDNVERAQDSLRSERDALQSEVLRHQTLRDQIEGQKQSIHTLEDSLDNVERARDSLGSERDALQSEVLRHQTLKDQIEGQKQSIHTLENSLDNEERARDSLRSERDALQSEVSRHQKLAHGMAETASQVRTEKDSIRENMLRMQDMITCYQRTGQERKDMVEVRTEPEVENSMFQMSFGDLSREIADHREKIKRLQASSSEGPLACGEVHTLRTVVAKWVDHCWDADEKRGNDTLLESTSGTSRKWKYECLEGLAFMVATKVADSHEALNASAAGYAYKMQCDTRLQVARFRGENKLFMRHIELSGLERNSDGKSFLQMEGDGDVDIHKLLTENSTLKESLARLEQEVDNLQMKMDEADGVGKSYLLEIERLINANASLQSKSIELIKVNEAYRASVAALNETVNNLKAQMEECTRDGTRVRGKTEDLQNDTNEPKEDLETRSDEEAIPQSDIIETGREANTGTPPTKENALLQTENNALKRQNRCLFNALTRLTNRAALHQEKLSEMSSRQSSLERQKAELLPTVLARQVQKINARAMELQMNNDETDAQRQEGSEFQTERE